MPRPGWIRWVFIIAGTAGILILALGTWAYLQLRLSLPMLEGTVTAIELSAPVTVIRDAQGVPTVTGQTRTDLAWALGYLHAQERFFQMDGQRRIAAGELAGLAGSALLDQDRERRVHRFRHRARAALAAMVPEERQVLDAYVAGVNRGLSDLAAAPFEYILLRSTPNPWSAEDTVLTVYAMYLDLQEADGATELRRARAEEALGQPLATFLFPEGTSWDASVDGSSLPLPAMPDSRAAKRADNLIPTAEDEVEVASPGSNSWAVGGALSTRGAAIVANDMHLSLRVPNIWYRAKLVQNNRDGATILNITGVTLPGAPNLVAGSNGKIAWGFTNSFADASDVVILEPAGEDPNLYRTPAGPQPFARVEEQLCPKGAACESLLIEESLWGPVVGTDRQGRKLAYRWIAHDPAAVNLRGMLELERAETTRLGLEIAHRLGIPHQNLVVGDTQGNIGWTVTTVLPRRHGFDGRLPASWADGTKGWSGYLAPEEMPVIYNPEHQRIWTANSRVVGGEALEKLGFGAYSHASRARQIRDRLFAQSMFNERDFLSIQLDDRGLLLERWQALLLQRLRSRAGHAQSASLIAAVESWGGRAVPESIGYRLVRTFRSELISAVYAAYTAPMRLSEPPRAGAQRSRPIVTKQADEPVWRLLSERPAHLVPPGYPDWDAVVDAGIEKALAAVDEQVDGRLEAFTWGAANRTEIKHPLTQVVPGLSILLNPPNEPQPGDLYQPRAASPGFGASERFVVAPGHEETGIFHMPTSQTGHPLSPYYNQGHEDWVQGRASPFLPGEPKWRMVFWPQ